MGKKNKLNTSIDVTKNRERIESLRAKLLFELHEIVSKCNEPIFLSTGHVVSEKGNIRLGYSVHLSTFIGNDYHDEVGDFTNEFDELPDGTHANDFIGITDTMQFVFDNPFGEIQFIAHESLSLDTIAAIYDFVLTFPQSK